jgi:hypothetical protein
VPPAAGIYVGLTFSRDGNYVYYVRVPNTFTAGTAYRVPTLGGDPQRLIGDVWSMTAPALSPGDKRMAFLREGPGGETDVVVAGTAEAESERSPHAAYLRPSIAWLGRRVATLLP